MAKEDFIFFWNGTYSQWEPSKFTIDNVEYNCCEQYMMAQKALMFNDLDSYTEIMKSTSPRQQKELGRSVKGFDKETWEAKCQDIVYEGNYAKFTQNPHMKEELMATGNLEIVEASPYDTIWGIGLGERDPLAWNKSTWKGLNWLGIAIMRVRTKLCEEDMFFMEQKLTNNR